MATIASRPTDGDVTAFLESLGPHSTGKGCVYIKRLEDVDAGVLEQLVRNAWRSAAASS